jgi:hypothetical protein
MSAQEILTTLKSLGVVVTATLDGFLDLEPAELLTADLIEIVREKKQEVLEYLSTDGRASERLEPRDEGIANQDPPGMLRRLPSELESLIRAATNESLPASADLGTGIVPDFNRFVLAWGCVYLIGSNDALDHLWAAQQAWRDHLDKILN